VYQDEVRTQLLTAATCCCLCLLQSNLPYELDATSLNTYGECTMNGQLKSPVLAAHYRIMPGRQQFLQQQQQQQQSSNGNDNGHAAPVNNGNGSGKCSNGNGANGSSRNSSTAAQQPQLHAVGGPDGRTFVGFSFNAGLGSDAEILFYDFGGGLSSVQGEGGAIRASLAASTTDIVGNMRSCAVLPVSYCSCAAVHQFAC
jgi:hypothetical protein